MASPASAKTTKKMDVEWIVTKTWNVSKRKLGVAAADKWKPMGNIIDIFPTRDMVDLDDGDHGVLLKLSEVEHQIFMSIKYYKATYRGADHHKEIKTLMTGVKPNTDPSILKSIPGPLPPCLVYV